MAKKSTPNRRKDLKKPSTGEKIVVRHDFTADEMKTKTQDLARTYQRLGEKKEQCKAVAATAKAEIKQMESEVSEMMNQVQNGYEDREIQVLAVLDRKKGIKSYYHECPGQEEHGRFIKDAPMTEEDFALLPIEDRPSQKPEEKQPELPPAPPTEPEPETEEAAGD